MTLIAAFCCEVGGLPGVVVCADSQETADPYIVEVKKIAPRDAHNYDLVLGISGHSVLARGLEQIIERAITSWPSGLSETQIETRLNRIVDRYNKDKVIPYPDKPEDKDTAFLICLRDKTSGNVRLWKTEGNVVTRHNDHALVGWHLPLYEHEINKLYRPDLTASQAVLLGVHLFAIAKATSLYIDYPLQIVGMGDGGLWVEDVDDVSSLQHRVGTLGQALNELTLAIPDLSIGNDKFEEMLSAFVANAVALREQYTDAALRVDMKRNWPTHPYAKYDTISLKSFAKGHLSHEKANEVCINALASHFVEVLMRGVGPDRDPERMARVMEIVEMIRSESEGQSED